MEAWKEAWESKGLKVNVKRTKMMFSSENAGKVTMEGEFPSAVCRKGVGVGCIRNAVVLEVN